MGELRGVNRATIAMVLSTVGVVALGVAGIHSLDHAGRNSLGADAGEEGVSPATSAGAALGDPGAPGAIVLEPRLLEQPPGHVGLEACGRFAFQWVFPSMNAEASIAELREGGLTVQTLAEVGVVSCLPSGCTVVPTRRFVETISPTVRQRLYAVLGRHAENPTLGQPYRRPLRFGSWSNAPGLSTRARQLLHALSWRDDTHEWFADEPLLCEALTDPREKLRMIEVLRTRYGLSASISITPTTDFAALGRWWSRGTHAELVADRLGEALRSPTRTLAVRDLLPPFPRARLDTFPRVGEPAYDCFWSALRFFDPSPDQTLPGTEGFSANLSARFTEVSLSSMVFGDVMVFFDASGVPIHAMNFIANDLVFTKNGGSFRRPWVFQQLSEVRLDYSNAPSLRAFRLTGT